MLSSTNEIKGTGNPSNVIYCKKIMSFSSKIESGSSKRVCRPLKHTMGFGSTPVCINDCHRYVHSSKTEYGGASRNVSESNRMNCESTYFRQNQSSQFACGFGFC